jgi:hypothetical protein
MEQHSSVPTHRRQSSDPPGGFDFASVLQQFGNEEMKVEEGELLTKDGRVDFETVAAAAVAAVAATGEVIDKSILENELWRTMNEGANKRSRLEEGGAGAAASGRRNRTTTASSWEDSFIASDVASGGAMQRKRPLIPKVVSESSDHDDPHPKPSPAARGMRGSYKCSRCGQKKSNHVCTAVSSLSVSVGIQTVALDKGTSAMWPSHNDNKFVLVGSGPTLTAKSSSSLSSSSYSAAAATGAGAGAAGASSANSTEKEKEKEAPNPP